MSSTSPSPLLILHTCHFKDLGGSVGHPCGKAAKALRDNGHDFKVRVAATGHPFGIATAGRRPQIKVLSGQEKLPVLELPGRDAISGSAQIIQWAKHHRAGQGQPASRG